MSVSNAAESSPETPHARKRGHAFLLAWRFLHPLLLAAGAVGIGFLLVLVAEGLGRIEGRDWGRFLTSPGAAGLAAVAAAVIGATALTRQLNHSKAVERDAAWWKSFQWVTDRALPGDGSPGLPHLVSVDMLTPLARSATDTVQQRACGAFLDHLLSLTPRASATDEILDEPLSDANVEDPPELADPRTDEPASLQQVVETLFKDNRRRSTLEDYARVTASSSARSVALEAQLYDLEVADALRRLDRPKIILPKTNAVPITVYSGTGSRVRVVPSDAPFPLALNLAGNAARDDATALTLLVTKGSWASGGVEVSELVHAVQWRDQGDDEQLRGALVHAFGTGPAQGAWNIARS